MQNQCPGVLHGDVLHLCSCGGPSISPLGQQPGSRGVLVTWGLQACLATGGGSPMNLLQSDSQFHSQHEALTLLSKVLREFLYFQEVFCIHRGPGSG